MIELAPLDDGAPQDRSITDGPLAVALRFRGAEGVLLVWPAGRLAAARGPDGIHRTAAAMITRRVAKPNWCSLILPTLSAVGQS